MLRSQFHENALYKELTIIVDDQHRQELIEDLFGNPGKAGCTIRGPHWSATRMPTGFILMAVLLPTSIELCTAQHLILVNLVNLVQHSTAQQ
eukprot:1075070-Pelagomonas_calceolata.AAC.1